MDDAVRIRLASIAASSGLKQSDIGKAADLSQNRVGIILRGETPPATIGEIYAIASALGASALRILQEAEEAVAAGERASLSVVDGVGGGADGEIVRPDDGLPDVSQLAARRVASRPSWNASQAGADAGEEPQD